MKNQREVALWPTKDNYEHFAALCDDSVPSNFDDFERQATAAIERMAAQGVVIEKIAFNPDKMAQWCRANCGQIDANARAQYAAFLALSD